jgi:hypothetical protein
MPSSSWMKNKPHNQHNISSELLGSWTLFIVRYSYLLSYGAEPFSRSCKLCSHSRTSQHFKKPEGSLPCSQEPSTGLYAEPDWSSPYHPFSLRSILILSTHLLLGLRSALSFWLSHQYPIWIPLLPHSSYMFCPTHPPWLHHSNYVWWEVQVMKLIMQFPPSPVTSSLFGPKILLSTLFSNTVSLYSSLNVRDQVSHPYRTIVKILVLYILIFMLSYGILESRKHNVSEAKSVSVLRWGGKTPTHLGPLERASLNHWNTGRWTKAKNLVILSVIHHSQNLL